MRNVRCQLSLLTGGWKRNLTGINTGVNTAAGRELAVYRTCALSLRDERHFGFAGLVMRSMRGQETRYAASDASEVLFSSVHGTELHLKDDGRKQPELSERRLKAVCLVQGVLL